MLTKNPPPLAVMIAEMQQTSSGRACIERALGLALTVYYAHGGEDGDADVDGFTRILLEEAYTNHMARIAETMAEELSPGALLAACGERCPDGQESPSPPRELVAAATFGPDLESRIEMVCMNCGQVSRNGKVDGTPCPECVTW